MTTYPFLSDAISMASLKAMKEDRRYRIDDVQTEFGYQYAIRPANPWEAPDIYVEADGTVVKKSEVDTKK